MPLCWGGYCLMCQPDGTRYPLQMESAPAGRRKVQYLELLCPSKYRFLGCSCDGVKCSLVDVCWRLLGSWNLRWCAGGCSCSQSAAHHRLLCCAGGGTPAPAPWASVPQELPYSLIPYQSQQVEMCDFSRCWPMHSCSVLEYLHFVLLCC